MGPEARTFGFKGQEGHLALFLQDQFRVPRPPEEFLTPPLTCGNSAYGTLMFITNGRQNFYVRYEVPLGRRMAPHAPLMHIAACRSVDVRL